MSPPPEKKSENGLYAQAYQQQPGNGFQPPGGQMMQQARGMKCQQGTPESNGTDNTDSLPQPEMRTTDISQRHAGPDRERINTGGHSYKQEP
jgi:hypothetical protein